MQPTYAQAQLAVSTADDVQNLSLEGARAAAGPPRMIQEGLVAFLLPAGPPAGERRVGHLRYHAEAASAQSGPPAAALLEGDDVPNPCRRRPWCANLVHVGPPVVCRLFGLAYPTARPDSFSPPSLSHMSWNTTLVDAALRPALSWG